MRGARGKVDEGKETQALERGRAEKKKEEKREKKKEGEGKKSALWEGKLFLFLIFKRLNLESPHRKKASDPLAFPNGSETPTPDFQTHGPSHPSHSST